MLKKIVAGLLVAVLMVCDHAQIAAAEINVREMVPAETEGAGAPDKNSLYAKSAVLMDADSRRILYEKNGYEALANASTTKILTCILALENCDLESEVTASALAASQPKVHLGMREGQRFFMKDLLYALMLESFNDCAVAIAEHIAGTTEGFAAMMNDKARELGCTDTYFITPNGLDAQDENGFHHTTAADLALIMRYCIKNSPKSPEFLTITGTSQYSFSDLDGGSSYSCYNHNAFLQMMEGALSGKTGFTGTAGYCYVGSLTRDDRTYIVALLACGWPNNKTYKWSDTKKLMNYGLENFKKVDLTEIELDDSRLTPVPVINGQSERIGGATQVEQIVSEADGPDALLLGSGEQIEVNYELSDRLYAPVQQGDYIGRITYTLGDEIVRECRVTAADTVAEIDFAWCAERVLELLWI